jgi:hypothetical protein
MKLWQSEDQSNQEASPAIDVPKEIIEAVVEEEQNEEASGMGFGLGK